MERDHIETKENLARKEVRKRWDGTEIMRSSLLDVHHSCFPSFACSHSIAGFFFMGVYGGERRSSYVAFQLVRHDCLVP